MSSEYRNLCDFCGKETKGFCDKSQTDKELATNNWDVRIDNMWWESDDKDLGLSAMKKEYDFNKDACLECAGGARKVLDEYFDSLKSKRDTK